MSNLLNTPAAFPLFTENLIAANGTNAKIFVDCLPPSIVAAITGETALPGEGAVRQCILRGGGRVIDGSVSSTDGSAKSLLIYNGERLTDQSNAGVMSLTTSGVARTAGSFISDGWTVGNALMLFGPPLARNIGSATQANTGLLAIVTAVSALALSVSGTPFTVDAALPPGARLFRVSQHTRRAIPASAGNADGTPPVPLIGGTQDPSAPSQPDAGWEMGQSNAVIVALVAAVSALPARIDLRASVAIR
ncbi:hypothetical protein D3877_10415 [Azospirillum cavernae]|uniref:Uncharacterized protein n=1 Tax=Azospirillum cavernae TaxID=2320860 RepID=A0A418W4D0_9PROT|nr:hypothetical protein [Azospirillum cavernae]RJF84881.1 hypothetical protein D3877_10415 [Azospirillum cavernae]